MTKPRICWTNFGGCIVDQWRENFPAETSALERAGLLYTAADDCAIKACALIAQALRNGERFAKSEKNAEVFWWYPPNIDPTAKAMNIENRPEV